MAKKKQYKQLSLGAGRSLAKMPEGYYSGDKPNPNLKTFMDTHLRERPYDPENDTYKVPAFDEPIKTTKASAIYNMHTYWSKKPHDAIRQYIRHYTQPGDLVLDPLCGSGGTALAALIEGRKAIAIDRSPVATFITKNYCTQVDIDGLKAAFEELEEIVQSEMELLYQTRCDRCGGKAVIAYTVYSQTFQCPRCLKKITLFDCKEAKAQTASGRLKKISVCPDCYQHGFSEEIKTSSQKFGAIPVLVSYLCQEGCSPIRSERRHDDPDKNKRRYFEKYDIGKIREIEEKKIPHWWPKHRMMNVESDTEPWGAEWRHGRNFRTVAELFTKRNLWALAAVLAGTEEIGKPYNDVLKFTVSSFLLNLSRLYKHRKGGGGQPTGNYYIPQINRENEAWGAFKRKFNDILKAYEELAGIIESTNIIISTENAVNLTGIPSNSVDLIFTDPPYAGKYQYGELNFIWEAWLQLDTEWHDEEITINQIRGKTEADWTGMMRQVMGECFRVLKPGRWLALCYHDTSEGTWSLVQDIMTEVGFLTDVGGAALYIDTGQKTYNQSQADKVTKRDLVINFRKPKHSEVASAITISGEEDETTFREKVLTIIKDYLLEYPGATKDRIYDEIVTRLVRKGRMEAFDFDRVLTEIAEPISKPVMKNLFEQEDPNLFGTHEIKRWYLKETVDRVDDAEIVREDAAAAKLETFMTKYLKKHPEREGVHYSDLFEQIVVMERPRREMADWLIDYFYKTEEGTWRPPMTDEEREEKAKQRATGALRKIKNFARLLESGAPVPERLQPVSDQEIADWIHQARRAGLYHQGKVIFEKSDLNLSRLEEVDENLAMDVNEDYQYCLKQLGEG